MAEHHISATNSITEVLIHQGQSSEENGISHQDFTPREYQVEIFEEAMNKNTIALLGTGTGKTFISVMLIRHLSYQVAKPFNEGGKRTIFLVPTVPLAIQQCETIQNYTSLTVDCYYGSKDVDNWSAEIWKEEFVKNQVLVMTADVFKIILTHGFLGLSQVNLIVFDECHKAVKNYAYCDIMKCFRTCPPQDRPRVLGLTASLVNANIRSIKALEDEIKSLELTMMSHVMTAGDMASLKKYGTDPTEKIVFYEEYDISAMGPKMAQAVTNLTQAHQLLCKPENHFSHSEEEENVNIYFTSPKKCVNAIKTILTTLGPLCAYFSTDVFKKEIKKTLALVMDPTALRLLKITLNLIQNVHNFVNNFLEKQKDLCLNAFFPPKLQKLLKIIKTINKFLEDQGDELCCIIFVEQRITAYVLNAWLKQISQKSPSYRFIQSRFIVGHGKTSGIVSKMSHMNIEAQTKLLKEFKNKQYNVLIATSVIEEGMDVRMCNLVIRFDPPKDFRAYMQSKGRARAKNAYFISLINSKDIGSSLEHVEQFRDIEKFLSLYCHNRELPSEDEVQIHLGKDIIPPYMPDPRDGKPRLTCTSAISLINRYCSLLSTDPSVTLVPSWKLEKIHLSAKNLPAFQCTLHMPINCPLREPIVGQVMPRKKYAKISAAFNACIELYKAGEFDEYFIPISKKVTIEDLAEFGFNELGEDDTDAPKIGTSKRYQNYAKKIAKELSYKPDSVGSSISCFINILHLKMVRQRKPENPNYALHTDHEAIALITFKQIPQVPDVMLFTVYGDILVSMETQKSSSSLTLKDFLLLRTHTRMVLEDMGFRKKGFLEWDWEAAPYSPLFAPITDGQINWKIVEESYEDYTSGPSSKPKHFTGSSYVFSKAHFANAVFIPYYRHTRELYFLRGYDNDKNPLSNFPSKRYSTFADYYEKVYGRAVTDTTQPLMMVTKLHRLTLMVPLPEVKKKKKLTEVAIKYQKYYIPELCKAHPIPASLWRQFLCLPTYLHRLNSLLLVEDLRREVSRFSSPLEIRLDLSYALDREFCSKNLNPMYIYPYTVPPTEDGSRIAYFDHVPKLDNPHAPPSPILLLQALTTKRAGDMFNLERLETIGDSFLKYIITVLIYKRYNTNEGKLHLIRCHLVCNKMLYKLAYAKGIPEIIQSLKFNTNLNWIPPGFHFKSDLIENTDDISYTTQPIADKSVADAVEALLGAYLLTCGPVGALKFMSWLGYDVLTEELRLDNDRISRAPLAWLDLPPPSILIKENEDMAFKLDMLYANMDKFEEQIGYTFKNKTYLVQAFTHASFIYNRVTPCYQRLEFLGDAVLDFIITNYIFKDVHQHSPGMLTDLRSSLVCNPFFAFMAAKHGFDKYLKMHSFGLFRDIKLYNEVRKPDTKLADEEQLLEYMRLEYDEMTIDSPKVLSDLWESVAGAIYLDSGMSLDTVWRIYFPMMKPALDKFSKKIPESIVQRVYRKYPQAKFVYLGVLENGLSEMELHIPGLGTFRDRGPTKVVAKNSVARQALVHDFDGKEPKEVSARKEG